MQDSEIIERLAEFMGFEKFKSQWILRDAEEKTKRMIDVKYWNPLKDWNIWREVEEKVMEDDDLAESMFLKILNEPINAPRVYICADLPTRCSALVSVLQND